MQTTHQTQPATEAATTTNDEPHWTHKATPWLGGYTLAEIIDTGLIQDITLIITRAIF